jgi:hypothetical protein
MNMSSNTNPPAPPDPNANVNASGSRMNSNMGAVVLTISHSTQQRYEVPILEDAEGYPHWRFYMRMVLKDSKLLNITKGRVPKPDAAVDTAGHKEWKAKDLKARIQITGALQKGALNLIMQAETTQECWEKLSN